MKIGHVITERDLKAGLVAMRRDPVKPLPQWTADESRIVGHTVLRAIPSDSMIDVKRDIN